MEHRTCKKCGNHYLLTKENFGHTPSGGFRYVCRKCIAKNVAAHTKKNPEMAAQRSLKRRIGLQNQDTIRLTQGQIRQLREKLNDCCKYCGVKLNGGGDLEHMIPISRGGENNYKNITLSCYTCNKEKHNKTVDEYLLWRKKLGLPIRNQSK